MPSHSPPQTNIQPAGASRSNHIVPKRTQARSSYARSKPAPVEFFFSGKSDPPAATGISGRSSRTGRPGFSSCYSTIQDLGDARAFALGISAGVRSRDYEWDSRRRRKDRGVRPPSPVPMTAAEPLGARLLLLVRIRDWGAVARLLFSSFRFRLRLRS
ncbi:hypothetical protein BDW66DRAFT_77407 [Aspergillus desertorum]